MWSVDSKVVVGDGSSIVANFLQDYLKCSFPDSDPHIFGPPGSGSFYHQAKTVRKNFIPTAL